MKFLKEADAKIRVWWNEKRRWSGVDRGLGPRVFYGFESIGDRSTVVSGGLVKVQDLQLQYPNCCERPNLLYLVSSAIPSYAPLMVKIAKSRGARFVLNQNGVAYPAWHGAGWEKTNTPNRLLLQSADHVVYQSQFCKLAADRFIGPCTGSWEVLHNPVDTEFFSPGKTLPLDPIVLVQAGTHNRFYRVESAIRTLGVLTKKGINARLLLAGCLNWRESESEAIKEMEGLARVLGVLHLIERRGGYTQEEAVSIFRSAHILLHTKYNDDCPRLVVEAMACGLPVVYSATGGVPELVSSSAGVGVPAPLDWEKQHVPEPEKLADGVLKILSAYESYASNARRRAVERFDVKPWISKHAAVFERLLKER